MATYPLEKQLAEVDRELALRKQLYADWIKRGKIRRSVALEQYHAMQAVRLTIQHAITKRDGVQLKISAS